jgi:two-component system, chemotaxis family, protein-glutamate methylesterase/glutaminase
MRKIAKRSLESGQRIRLLVVDDSVVIRRLVHHALEPDKSLEVVGVAANGRLALAKIPQVNPDVITLDIEMPEMDGLETLRHIRRDYPDIRVIMFSTLTQRGAAATLEALALGADDYVAKVSNEGGLSESLARLREDLIPKIKQFFSGPEANRGTKSEPIAAAPARRVEPPAAPMVATVQVVGIGVSTGGPAALGVVLPEFPEDFELPVLVVQHMPPMFTRLLAERLHATCRIPVHEARDGDAVAPGQVLIAPGDFHMRVARAEDGVRIQLDQSTPLNSCRPAVDALFTSLAQVYGGAVTAAILTGMGQDGLRGVEALYARGAYILAQDESSSVVWGMPGAVVNAGLANAVLPLEQLPGAILRRTGYRTTPADRRATPVPAESPCPQ